MPLPVASSDRLIRGTPFYPRTAQLNERQKWNAWDQYHIVDAYTDWRLEVKRIREEAAALDQSPLAKHFIKGPDAGRFVDYLIPRDVTIMEVGQIYFTPWCNHEGAQVGDGLVARLESEKFLFSADPMMQWLRANKGGSDVELEDVTHDFGLLALQGPKSTAVLEAATGEEWNDLRFSRIRRTTLAGVSLHVGRQGFTGEAGGMSSGFPAMMASRCGMPCSPPVHRSASASRPPRGRRCPDRSGARHTGVGLHPGGD